MDLLSDQYETYKKIYDLTGNSTGASSVAFGGASVGATYKAYLESRMASILGKNSKYAASEVMGMSKDDFNKTFGSDNHKGLAELYNRWHENEKNINKESLDLMLDVIKNHRTLDQQIADENREYERQLLLISGIKDATLRSEAKRGLDESHSETVSKLQLEKFKKESDWVTVFDNLDRVSTGTIKSMMALIEKESKNTGLRPEDIKTLRDALEKLNEKLAERSPLSVMKTSLSQGNAIRSFINDVWQKSYAESNRDAAGNPVYNVTDADAGKMGITTGQYTLNQMMNFLSSSETDFTNSIQGLSTQFKACADILSPVIDLFEALGETNLADIVGVGQNALGSAANTAGAFSTLSKSFGEKSAIGSALGSAGPYAAAAAAALSVASSIIGGKSASQKAYEKQAEYLKNIQGTVSEINGNLKEKVSSSYGSASQQAGMAVNENLKLEAEETRNTYYAWSMAKKHKWGNRNRMKTNLDFNQINAYLREIGYTGPDVGGDSIQTLSGDYLEKIREHFPVMWAKIPDEAKELLNRIIEIEKESGEIAKNAEATVKALTDMDLDTLKSEYKDLLDQLDSDNEDFADNFEKHLRNAILSGMIANLYADRIAEMNNNLAKAGGTESGNKYIDKYGNIRTHTGGDDSANVASEYTSEEYQKGAEEASLLGDEMRNTRDILARLYGWSDNSSSKAGSSIKGITEEQSDLLISYVNAMRLDLSVNRVKIQQIADAVSAVPELNNIAKSQLSQLQTLVSLAQYRNGKLDDMYSWMKSVTKEGGTKHLSV